MENQLPKRMIHDWPVSADGMMTALTEQIRRGHRHKFQADVMNTVIKEPMVKAGDCPSSLVRGVSLFAAGQALARRQADGRHPGLKLGAAVLLPARPVSPLRFTRN